MTELQITSRGATLQGTGRYIGTRQYFIRLAGCALKTCPLRSVCDEPFSLAGRAGHSYDMETLLREAEQQVGLGGWIHITGGEPSDNPKLPEFLALARERGFATHLQTHGGNDLPYDACDWVTVSPKVLLDDLKVRGSSHGEMVIVLNGQSLEELTALQFETRFARYYLQPKWADGAAQSGLEETIAKLREMGSAWLGTIQAHKYWGCT